MLFKEEYTVNEVASILQTNPETVRKWIKKGDLSATPGNSKKEGMRIDESALESFLSENPKYTAQAYITATLAILTGGVSIPASIIFNAQRHAKAKKQQDSICNSRIKASVIIQLLEDEIKQELETIDEKEKQLESIEKEIADRNDRIDRIKEMIIDLQSDEKAQISKKDLTVGGVSGSKKMRLGRTHKKKTDSSQEAQ